MTGIAKGTVLSLLADLGKVCAEYHDEHVRGVQAQRIQCDEIWSFCYGKDKNISQEKKAEGAGSLWTWTALDADSKLIVSYLCGGRDAAWANSFMEDVASRLTTRVQITTDGHKAYVEAVEGAFGMDVDYAMLIKLYGSPAGPETRYSPGVCIGTETVYIQGTPDPRHVCILCGTPEPYYACVNEAVHAVDERLLEENRESRAYACYLFSLL